MLSGSVPSSTSNRLKRSVGISGSLLLQLTYTPKAVCMGHRPRCSLAALNLPLRATQHPFADVSQHVLLRDTPTKLGPSPHQPYKASLGCLEDSSETIISSAHPQSRKRTKTLACFQGSGRSCVASDMPSSDRSSHEIARQSQTPRRDRSSGSQLLRRVWWPP